MCKKEGESCFCKNSKAENQTNATCLAHQRENCRTLPNSFPPLAFLVTQESRQRLAFVMPERRYILLQFLGLRLVLTFRMMSAEFLTLFFLHS